jgi:hypothetical protein
MKLPLEITSLTSYLFVCLSWIKLPLEITSLTSYSSSKALPTQHNNKENELRKK